MDERQGPLRVTDVDGWQEVLQVQNVTLRQWALGSFHAALLLVIVLLVLHLSDGLAGALPADGTLVGSGIYLLLVASAVLTIQLVDGPAGLNERRDLRGTFQTVGWGALGGSVNGVLFLLGLVAAASIPFLVVSPGSAVLLPLALAFGSVVAAVVGFVLGFAFVLGDLLLVRTALWLVPDDRPEQQ